MEGNAVDSKPIAVILGSSRKGGNSESLARLAVAPFPESEVDWIDLKNYRINGVIDQRHDPGGFRPQEDDYASVLRRVLDARAIVLATPVYWYALPSRLKAFIDRWSESLRDPVVDFRSSMAGKRLYLIITGAERDTSKFDPVVASVRLTAAYLRMDVRGVLAGSSDRPGDVMDDARLRSMAEAFLLNEPLSY